MATVDTSIVTLLLLGRADHRRQLQDFPVLVDVWEEFAHAPAGRRDLLITPHREVPAARVAAQLEKQLEGREGDHRIAYLQGLVVASLDLEEVYRVVIPATYWWANLPTSPKTRPQSANFKAWISEELQFLIGDKRGEDAEAGGPENESPRFARLSNAERQQVKLGLLVGLLLGAGQADKPIGDLAAAAGIIGEEHIAELGAGALEHMFDQSAEPLIFNVSVNRQAEYAISKSVPAIKADAARQLFNISCSELSWAILDSGIDAAHPAFIDHKSADKKSRVVATYDFGKIRRILDKANRFRNDARKKLAKDLAGSAGDPDVIDTTLLELAKAMASGAQTDWSRIEPLIRRDPDKPSNPHGTHVAGILAADRRDEKDPSQPATLLGVCPDIKLYDFRVLGPDMEQSEFAVIAALQFIRYLNDRNASSIIDGVNMSLSIPHNVRNYACGRTPVCLEAELLAANGVVVVAAAGNRGYQSYRLADDTSFESYAASSITDPGNAEGVITVGATHRYWPHTYGVSFFSSRGPTGDGRLKPDVLAPGERIDSCVPGDETDTMDGTSMAAPHVSGAAALLMARHRELKGNPRKIKEILCDTATDLGRERAFQGHGMVDVLRALQSI